MVKLFSQRVVLGKSAFSELRGACLSLVPSVLEEQVAEDLITEGFPELVPVRLGGTGVK